MRHTLESWITLARKGDYRAIMEDNALRSYSSKTVARQKAVATLVSALTKPRDFSRFLTPRIFCPTLIIGDTEDRIVTAEGSRELAGQIGGAELFLYEGLSHALYEEAGDFLDRVRDFCLKE